MIYAALNNDINNTGDTVQAKETALDKQILSELKKLNDFNEKQAEEEAAEKKAQEAEVKAQEEEAAKDQEQAELKEAAQEEADQTQAEVLQNISTNLEFHNQLTVSSFLLYGVITGILLFKILWDRLKA